MAILITGGAGFIGSNLCEKIINLGEKVVCIDNFNDFYNPRIKENNISSLADNKNFVLYREDILNKQTLNEIFSKHDFDLVIHLAARAGVLPSLSNALLYETINVQGTVNLLDNCRDFKVKKFIFASSSSVYGGNKKIPFSESDNVDHPISPYAATKKAGELLCFTYNHLYDISIYCLRLFTVYGPRQRPEMAIHKFTRNIFNGLPVEIYGDGSSSRDYTYIDDITDTIISNLDNIKSYEIINLGNSKPVKLSELISLIEKITGIKADKKYNNFKPGDVFTTYADISKAKKMLKYNPKISIEEGLKKFTAWYMDTKNKGKLYE